MPVRLVVTELAEGGLRLEPAQLLHRVVQLAERVGRLSSVHDELEALVARGAARCVRQSGDTFARVIGQTYGSKMFASVVFS